MKTITALAGILVAGYAFAATAADVETYYLVQDVKTKKCSIVDKKPVGTTYSVVSDSSGFKTRVEAEKVMKTTKVCTTE